MEIITNIDTLLPVPTVATIGSFDGVHRGHAAMIAEARALAAERGLPLTVITFAIHPRQFFNPRQAPFLLSSFNDKLLLLEQCGVDRCVLLPFDCSMAALSAREFMSRILRDKLSVKLLAVGYDHRFGTPCKGECVKQYIEYGNEFGIEVLPMAPYLPNSEKISSSEVRRSLAAGDVVAAAAILGRRYSICGTVVHGAALGRSLGFPTANIALDEPLQMLPLDGVYECRVIIDSLEYSGVMNVGKKPTLGGDERTIEVFILDFKKDIYNDKVCVEFVRRIRDERSFLSLDALRRQIEADVQEVIKNRE